MFNGHSIAVVIPAYNCERHIEETVRTLPEFVDYIVVVDDASQDRTAAVGRGIDESRLHMIENEHNLGVGGASKAGFREALDLDADIVVKVDGDGQMDPNEMGRLLEPLVDGMDYAKGNRFLNDKELDDMPALRRFGNLFLTFLTKLASGYWKVFDPQNGYVAIRRTAIELLDLDKIHNRYFFENDLLINLNIHSASVADVPMPARYGDEKSSMKISRILLTFPLLLVQRFFYRVYTRYVLRDFSVIGFFYFAGAFLMCFGALFGIYHWIVSVITQVAATTGTVMIAVLPITLGFQLFLQAIVAEIDADKSGSTL